MSEIFTFEKIYKAYLDCRKTKRKTVNALKFEYNLERNILALEKEFKTRKYKPGRSICFVVTEPCPREIFAAGFRDRVAHHILVREIETIGESKFIFDSFACRKKKGTHSAIKRLKLHIKKETENNKKRAFYMQLDISGFFMAINHNILYSILGKLILEQNKSDKWKEDVLWLAKTIIFQKPINNYVVKGNPYLFNLIPPRKSLFNSPTGKGLPIGNYSSQFFGNLYLNELDQFVKRELKFKNYVRYVDDFILLGKNKMKLEEAQDKINWFLKTKLDLELNLKKTKLKPISKGIDFLGYFVKPDYVLVRRRVVDKLKSKLSVYIMQYGIKCDNINESNLNKILATVNSYYGHFSHACSFNLRKVIFEKALGGGLVEKFYHLVLAKEVLCQITKK